MYSDEYNLYLRKSRADLEAEARGEGETLKRHENILLELARKMNIHIKEENIYREVVSGETIASRPVMQQLLSEVESGKWKGVLVVEVERLARGDTIDQGIVAQAFKYTNTKIITPMKVYDPSNEFDEEYFEFGLFMSRREYKTINRRLQAGRIQSVKEGKYLGTIPPYGYNRKKLEKEKGFTLEFNPDEAPIVELIFDLYVNQRLGVSLIVTKLNEMKIPPRKSDRWTTSTIQSILRNPVYKGKIRWNSRPAVKKVVDGEIVKERPRAKKEDWILVKGLHENIISEHLFNTAQEIMDSNKPLPVPRSKSVKNPLVGLLVCGVCGRKMKRRPFGERQEAVIMCSVPGCDNVSAKISIVEKKLIEALNYWLVNYKINLQNEDKNYGNNEEISILQQNINKFDEEIKTLDKQLNSLHDLLEQGVYSIETFIERTKLLNEKITIASQNKNELEYQIINQKKLEESKKIIIPKIESVIKLYDKTKDIEEKNNLLKEVLDKVIYIKTVNGRWHNREDDITLKLYPRVPK